MPEATEPFARTLPCHIDRQPVQLWGSVIVTAVFLISYWLKQRFAGNVARA